MFATRTLFVWFVYLCFFATLAPAQEKTNTPVVLPPHFCRATANEKDGNIQIRLTVPKMIQCKVARVVEVRDGKPIAKVETFCKACSPEVTLVADDKEVKFFRKDGTSVDPKSLLKLLKTETSVLVFTEGKLDSYFLQVVDANALIMTIPASKPFPWRPDEDD